MSGTSHPFVPPHCPRSDCRFHRSSDGWRWIHWGWFSRIASPRSIPRFRCVDCGVTFSSQTFATTYYLKRPELLEPIAYRGLTCSGYRQISREAGCHPTSVMGQAARLGRHCLLWLARHRAPSPVLEPLVIDGFESFAYSQYHPLHLHTVVGAESHLVYGFTCSRLRRKGTMTERQKRRRHAIEREHGRPEPKAVELDMAAALKLAVPTPQALTIRSDEHPAYRRSFQRLTGYSIRHQMTPSVEARTPHNPLYPVNLLDLLLRHNGSHHKRETIAFAKRHQAVAERAALLVVWRNFIKQFSERKGGGTPAMRAGIAERPFVWKQVLGERLFPSRVGLPEPWRGYYRRLIDTPGISNPRRHSLMRAF